jgi:hypothetical protein
MIRSMTGLLAVVFVVMLCVAMLVVLYKGLRYTGLSVGPSVVLLVVPQIALVVLFVRLVTGKGHTEFRAACRHESLGAAPSRPHRAVDADVEPT